jgi:non-ribosomal peptide synthetase component F
MERLFRHFQTLLEAIVENPQQPIHELPLLTEAEQLQFGAWNETAADYPRDKTLVDIFEEPVDKTPEAIAVVFEDQQLTYQALNTKANQLAHHLQRLGVKPEVIVGICLEPSLEMVLSLIGILKAGGAYLPLAPAYPMARLALMLEEAGVPVLLTQSSLVDKLPEHQAQVICLDDGETFSRFSTDNPVSGVAPSNLACVIYTSTVQPKGVLIPHTALLNLVAWYANTFKVTFKDQATHLASFAFETSVWELWPYLATGASVYLVAPDTLREPLAFRDWLV